MKERILFGAIAGLGLVSASPPVATAPAHSDMAYPACSRTVTDHCIQLYERGVRTRQNLAANRIDSPAVAMAPAAAPAPSGAGAIASTTEAPPCSATVTDHCQQRPIRLTARVRRAGERG
ncbi:MAG: hypothetical protein E6G92_06690 [Alphaproteobacteria bacterium]|nr:MAG: hypothetical protein E6G92_06690 [Alphaproteobacteria bacterium]